MAGSAVVLSKAGLKDLNPALAFAIQSVLILIISWTAAFWQKEGVSLTDIDRRTWLFLVAAGAATTFSSLFTFQALKLGDAALVTSVERVSLVFAIALAVFFSARRTQLESDRGGVADYWGRSAYWLFSPR